NAMTHSRERALRALLDFQSVMEQFLATQRDVVTTYLSSARESSVQTAGLSKPSVIARAIGEAPVVADIGPVVEPKGPTARIGPSFVRLTPRPVSRPAPA